MKQRKKEAMAMTKFLTAVMLVVLAVTLTGCCAMRGGCGGCCGDKSGAKAEADGCGMCEGE